jgi:hypothetical protein
VDQDLLADCDEQPARATVTTVVPTMVAKAFLIDMVSPLELH